MNLEVCMKIIEMIELPSILRRFCLTAVEKSCFLVPLFDDLAIRGLKDVSDSSVIRDFKVEDFPSSCKPPFEAEKLWIPTLQFIYAIFLVFVCSNGSKMHHMAYV